MSLRSGFERLRQRIGLGIPAALMSALLIVIAVSAAAIPAWRAVRVDPMIALRAE